MLFLAPFPPDLSGDHGGSRAIAWIVDTVARTHDVSVLYLRDSRTHGPQRPPSRCRRMIGIDVPFKGRMARPLWLRLLEAARLLFGGRPDWVRESWSPEMAKACTELAAEIRPDVVHFEFHVMGQYIPLIRKAAPEARCIVTEHEPAVTSIKGFGGEYRGIRQRLSSFARRVAWSRYERRTLSQADAVVAFTEKDEKIVREIVRGSSTETACIPFRFPPDGLGSAPPKESDLLFVGSFRHPPNADAAMRLATTIFPRVREALPKAGMCVVGADPPQELIDRAADGVEVIGRVDDVAPYLAGASVVICPLRLGGGMRVKALEACAFGKALIASPEAVEGLGIRPGVEFVAASTDDEFVTAAIDLLSDPERRKQLGSAASAWARRTQDPDDWAAQYDALYSRLTMFASTD